jgi:glycosyltransferase involved in cell wall biosynthesis
MILGKKVIVIMPAHNTASTLKLVIPEIPRPPVDEIILVDDGSTDGTSEAAKSLGLTVFRHEKNRGYGGAQKTAYNEALARGADIIVMVHSDFQYDPRLVPQLIEPLAKGTADVCFGSRMAIKKNALAGGMPWWRFVVNWALTLLENSFLRLGISEYHSGYRAWTKEILKAIPFEKNSDNYVFDTEMLVETSLGNFRAAEIPIPTRYRKESQSPSFYKSVEYGLMTLLQLLRYTLQVSGLKKYPQFDVVRKAESHRTAAKN